MQFPIYVLKGQIDLETSLLIRVIMQTLLVWCPRINIFIALLRHDQVRPIHGPELRDSKFPIARYNDTGLFFLLLGVQQYKRFYTAFAIHYVYDQFSTTLVNVTEHCGHECHSVSRESNVHSMIHIRYAFSINDKLSPIQGHRPWGHELHSIGMELIARYNHTNSLTAWWSELRKNIF